MAQIAGEEASARVVLEAHLAMRAALAQPVDAPQTVNPPFDARAPAKAPFPRPRVLARPALGEDATCCRHDTVPHPCGRERRVLSGHMEAAGRTR